MKRLPLIQGSNTSKCFSQAQQARTHMKENTRRLVYTHYLYRSVTVSALNKPTSQIIQVK